MRKHHRHRTSAARPASVTLEGAYTLRVSWTAPAQPVNGYRVEYSIGDDPWLELDAWLAAEERTLPITITRRRAAHFRFRVRAWNDAGVGEYSQPVTISFAKRRSVR